MWSYIPYLKVCDVLCSQSFRGHCFRVSMFLLSVCLGTEVETHLRVVWRRGHVIHNFTNKAWSFCISQEEGPQKDSAVNLWFGCKGSQNQGSVVTVCNSQGLHFTVVGSQSMFAGHKSPAAILKFGFSVDVFSRQKHGSIPNDCPSGNFMRNHFNPTNTRFLFTPTWGHEPIWRVYFQMGWNHQRE